MFSPDLPGFPKVLEPFESPGLFAVIFDSMYPGMSPNYLRSLTSSMVVLGPATAAARVLSDPCLLNDLEKVLSVPIACRI